MRYVGCMSRRLDRSLGIAPGSVSDYREIARTRLPRQMFDYIDGGSYEEQTMAANRADLASVLLRQRVLRDVGTLKTSVTVLGADLHIPVILAPVGLAGMFAPRAEVQAARAAEQCGITFCESTVSICSIDEIAAATQRRFWHQLYVMRDRAFAERIMARAHSASCDVLVLTVDLAVPGARYRDVRNGMVGRIGLGGTLRRGLDIASHPRWVKEVGLGGKPLTFGNLAEAVPGATSPTDFRQWVDEQFDPTVTWDDIAWVRQNWPGKLVLKGILDVEDARMAADHGVEGIVVSNHGGRQLDQTPSTASVLPGIAEAVGTDLAVLVDGGIRSGLDVIKALALGADAVLVGRAWAYAVAAGGQQAVANMLHIMGEELRVGMSLTGVVDVADLGPDSLVR